MNHVDGNIVFKPRLSYSLGWGFGLALSSVFCAFVLMLLINIQPDAAYSLSVMLIFIPVVAILFWGVTYLSDAINGMPLITLSKTNVEIRSIWGIRKTSLKDLNPIAEAHVADFDRYGVKIGATRIGNRYQTSLVEIVKEINSRRK